MPSRGTDISQAETYKESRLSPLINRPNLPEEVQNIINE